MSQQQLISDLPDWVPAEAWAEFLKMRKTIKKPLTEYAAKLVIKKLQQLILAGQDPQEVLDQSILNGWQGIFAVKGANSGTSQPQFQTPVEKARTWADSITGLQRDAQVFDINTAPPRRIA